MMIRCRRQQVVLALVHDARLAALTSIAFVK
jgi:hypothetical protein